MNDALPTAETLFTIPVNDTVASNRAREEARLAELRKGHWIGSKFAKDRSRADIKSAILADLKSAGLPKGVRVSAKLPSYSMADSIVFTVKVPFVASLPECVEVDGRWTRLTAAAREVHAIVERVANAHNYDRSDLLTDYHDRAFGLDIRIVGTEAA